MTKPPPKIIPLRGGPLEATNKEFRDAVVYLMRWLIHRSDSVARTVAEYGSVVIEVKDGKPIFYVKEEKDEKVV